MTCPFYRCDGRPECILGDTRAERHCGPRQYPQSPCNLDEIGRGDEWRAVLADVAAAATHPIWDPNYYDLFPEGEWGPLRAVGWLP